MMASTTDPGRTVLLTGGAGYLGSWVVARLLARGYRVRATVRGLGRVGALQGAVARQAPVDAADGRRGGSLTRCCGPTRGRSATGTIPPSATHLLPRTSRRIHLAAVVAGRRRLDFAGRL